MAHSHQFNFESRYDAATHSRIPSVGIECKRCHREEWAPAPNPGWGRNIFKNRGWILGNDRSHHTCPTCAEFRRTGKLPEGRVVRFEPPPPQPTPEPEIINTQLAEALAPVKAQMDQIVDKGVRYAMRQGAISAARRTLNKMFGIDAREGTHFRVEEYRGGYRYIILDFKRIEPTPLERNWGAAVQYSFKRPGEEIIGTYSNGRRSAELALRRGGVKNPKEGVHYRLHKIAGPIDKVTYEVIGNPLETGPVPTPSIPAAERKGVGKALPDPTNMFGYSRADNAARAAKSYLTRIGVADPTEGEHFEVVPDGIGYSVRLKTPVQPTQETDVVSDASTQVVRDLEAAQAQAAEVVRKDPEAVREATLADNRRIRQELDVLYDEENQRYQGDMSDQKLADMLDVPRIWVARVRELYGPDKNDAERLRKMAIKANLDEAQRIAGEALALSTRIIEDAAKLETLQAALAAYRKELDL